MTPKKKKSRDEDEDENEDSVLSDADPADADSEDEGTDAEKDNESTATAKTTEEGDDNDDGTGDEAGDDETTKDDDGESASKSDTEEEDMVSSSEEEDTEDEDYIVENKQKKKKSSTPRKSPVSNSITKRARVKSTLAVKATAAKVNKAAKKRLEKVTGRRRVAKSGKKSIQSALESLGKKVLEETETPDTSLVAALLGSFAPTFQGIKGYSTAPLGDDDAHQAQTIYTPQLLQIARSVVDLHSENPNVAQIELLNLLFRSVGGTCETNISSLPGLSFSNYSKKMRKMRDDNDQEEEMEEPHEEVELLEDMELEEWGQLVTAVVDEMRHTNPDCILFCADPDGAVHADTMVSLEAAAAKQAQIRGDDDDDEDEEDWDNGPDATPAAGSLKKNRVSHFDVPVAPSSLGVREYRKIFEEFWYVFGTVALCEGGMSTVRGKVEDIDSSDEEDTVTSKGKSAAKNRNASSMTGSSTRYDTEVIREVMNRLLELVSVGQPDVRAASTISVLCLAQAVADKTATLNDKLSKLSRQYAAASASNRKKGAKSGAKAEALGHQVDSLKRNKADLEELLSTVISAVFVHRYRDTNMFIRASCLNFLSRVVIRRPDLFLKDKYMKYFGWMMSDKSDLVRVAALEALSLPFDASKSSLSKSNAPIIMVGGARNRQKHEIDLSLMEHVCSKFLSRIIECASDMHVSVQESAMKLLLALLRNGFMDEIEDEQLWNQINLRALATDTSATVRRDALYFITEQLEAFDEDENNKQNRKGGKALERWTVQRLDAIASWCAHSLTDGSIPMEKIRIELADQLVFSLREMPEHKGLVTDWSAMLRAIMEDKAALTSQGKVAGNRSEVAKQRVLVQMLACAVKTEVGSFADVDFMQMDYDPDLIVVPKRVGKKDSSKGSEHENLSVALMKTLPGLLKKFSTDNLILKSLTSLPRLLMGTVFSLSQRKPDFLFLSKNLLDIYLQTTDEEVLQNTACSMKYLCKGDHARASEARSMMQNCLSELQTRIVNNLPREKKKENNIVDDPTSAERKNESEVETIPGDDDSLEERSKEMDREHTLYINLKRLRVLVKRFDIASDSDDDAEDDDDGEDGKHQSKTDLLFNSIADGLESILSTRKADSDTENDAEKSSDSTWIKADEKSVNVASDIIHEGMNVLLGMLAWKVLRTEGEVDFSNGDERDDEPPTEEDGSLVVISEHVVLDFRDRMVSLVEMCFDQYISDSDEKVYLASRLTWSENVQYTATLIASDLRTLFPKEWTHCVSPHLRALTLMNSDKFMMGGSVRYFRTKENDLRLLYNKKSNSDDTERAQALLLPLGRALAFNWKEGNRREAAVALSHINGSGDVTSDKISALTRLMKRVDPVRLLESQMQSLRQSFEEWIDSDPVDEADNYHTTDEEMTQIEEAEKRHKEQFNVLVKQAHRFSQNHGFKKADDANISQAMNAFMLEGIKYSFSCSDDLVLGCRLPFLTVLSKYAHWIKKDEKLRGIFNAKMIEEETALKSHDEFDDVHEDDLAAISDFRVALCLGPSDVLIIDEGELSMTQETKDIDMMEDDIATEMKTPHSRSSSSFGRHSRTNSVKRSQSIGSVNSLMSNTKASLSPLYEEQEQKEVEEGHHSGSDDEDSQLKRNRSDSFMDDDDNDDGISDIESPTRTPSKRKKYGSTSKYSRST